MLENYGVLVVDDSALMRKTISDIINASPNMTVIGRARNGLDAIEKIKRLQPSIVTLDVEMPELDGLETLKYLMAEADRFVPVFMITNDEQTSIEAMQLGAADYILKSQLLEQQDYTLEDFYKRMNVAIKLKPVRKKAEKKKAAKETKKEPVKQKKCNKELIVIGSSTGGPAALQKIITQFSSALPIPILIVQHMPPGFTKPLADRLNSLCEINVKEAEQNEILEAGTVYIAPAGIQTTLEKDQSGHYIVKQKSDAKIQTLYKPSIDVALLSISEIAKEKMITIILTGMGDDGLRGCRAVKKYGGTVIAESEETCVIYGMPKVVYEAGLADRQLPLSSIYEEIISNL